MELFQLWWLCTNTSFSGKNVLMPLISAFFLPLTHLAYLLMYKFLILSVFSMQLYFK